MKIGVIGGGISGLSIGQLLNKEHDVEILEKEDKLGGIAKVKEIEGIPYHMVGGHCFNSKNEDVLDYVFNKILMKRKWNKRDRISKINYKNKYIDYPFEFSIKQIAEFDFNLAYKMVEDFFKANRDMDPNNLEKWFRCKFGDTLAEEYFIPYNRKIWNREPNTMSSEWVEGKLPIPKGEDVFEALINEKKDNMPHSSFYYPKSNSQNSFIEALSKNLKIIKEYKVKSIRKEKEKFIINDDKKYDKIISTMPLKEIPYVIESTPNIIKDNAKKLKYNKVTTALWKSNIIDGTWIYIPSEKNIMHRHILIGNFITPKQPYIITEMMGEYEYEDILREGRKFSYLNEIVDYNVSDYAYVVYDKNYSTSKKIIKNYLEEIGIETLGRFGEWDYYNMDICIEKALELYDNKFNF